MLTAIVQDLAPRTRPARLLGATALFWLGSAVLHLVVWGVDGGAWDGAVSWRKPIVFSVSIATTLWAFGWVLDRMPVDRPRRARLLARAFAASSTVEVALIAVQAWRGRASHFNVAAPGDAVIFGLMGAAVAVMSLSLLALLVWVLREPPRDRATRWAVTGGLVAIGTGLGIGQWIIQLGTAWVEATGTVPQEVLNGAAAPTFPHAIAFHGIQVFALLLAAAHARGWSPTRRLALLRIGVLGYLAVLAGVTASTVAGVAPTQVRGWALAVTVAGATAVVAAGVGVVVPDRAVVTTT